MRLKNYLQTTYTICSIILFQNNANAFFEINNNSFKWGPSLIRSFEHHHPKFNKKIQCTEVANRSFSLKIANHACKIMRRYYEPQYLTCAYELKNEVERYCDQNPFLNS